MWNRTMSTTFKASSTDSSADEPEESRMRFDQLPRSDNVEDRRGDRSGFPMGRTGGIGLGTIILLGLVGWALGINPLYLIGGAEMPSGLCGSQQQSPPTPTNTRAGQPPDQTQEFVAW